MAAPACTMGFFKSPIPGMLLDMSLAHFTRLLCPLVRFSTRSISSARDLISLSYSRMALILSEGIHSRSARRASIFARSAPTLRPVASMSASAAFIFWPTPSIALLTCSLSVLICRRPPETRSFSVKVYGTVTGFGLPLFVGVHRCARYIGRLFQDLQPEAGHALH